MSFLDVMIAVAMGLLVFAPFTDGLDARGFGLAAVFVGIAEIFTVIRHRMSLRCGRCGFDPIVYRRSQEEAARIVRSHLERRAEDPRTLLAEPVLPYGRKRARDVRSESSPEP